MIKLLLRIQEYVHIFISTDDVKTFIISGLTTENGQQALNLKCGVQIHSSNDRKMTVSVTLINNFFIPKNKSKGYQNC